MVVFGIASREQRDVSTAALLRGSKAVVGFWLVHLLARRDLVAPMIGELLGAVAAGRARGNGRRRLPALRSGARTRRPDRPPDRRQATPGPARSKTKSTKIAFKDLGLSPAIQQALDELGFNEPTPIQEQAIPELLGGHDVIGQAQTGTGKTAAFGLPLLQYLDPGNNEVQAVVLTRPASSASR